MTFYTSISQVNNAELCLRKWGFEKIDKLARPSSKWQSLGIETHAQLANWLTSKQPPLFQGKTEEQRRAARIAERMIPHLPPPQTPNMVVEKKTEFVVEDITWVMIVDLGIYDGVDVPFISDHKTTTQLKWSLPEEDMHLDAQVALYSSYAMDRTGSDICDVQWTYGTTTHKAPRVKPVKRRLTRDEICGRMERSMETARLLRLVKTTPGISAMDLPYDAAACEVYGGCPYKNKCNLTAKERIQSIMAQDKDKKGFLARLKERQQNAGKINNDQPVAKPKETEKAEDKKAEATKKTSKKKTTAKKAPTTSKKAETPTPAEKPKKTPEKPKKTPEKPKKTPSSAGGSAGPTEEQLAWFTAGFRAGFNEGQS